MSNNLRAVGASMFSEGNGMATLELSVYAEDPMQLGAELGGAGFDRIQLLIHAAQNIVDYVQSGASICHRLYLSVHEVERKYIMLGLDVTFDGTDMYVSGFLQLKVSTE